MDQSQYDLGSVREEDRTALKSLAVNPGNPLTEPEPEDAPELPPKRSRYARNPIVVALNFFISLALLAVLAAGGLVYWGSGQFNAPGPHDSERTVMIERGNGLSEIADKLVDEGAISNALLFEAGVRFYENQARLKAGEYRLPARASMRDVMDIFVGGRAIEYSITIPEGLSSDQVLQRIRDHPDLVGDLTGSVEEGVLLPETYRFPRGTTRQHLLDRMRKMHDTMMALIWEKRDKDLPLSNPRELLILASIVEKETGRAGERARVAAVFVNRLRKRMRLESDPTILYGLYKGEAWSMPRTLRRSEMDKPNPYNTYKIAGLPPGPIANPGRAALEATANPARTKELFFVADGTGGHLFAENFDAHKKNVATWRKIEAIRRAEKKADAEVDGADEKNKPVQ